MKEHGIIFSAPMVRAIIEGRKTQTRRIIKNPEWYGCTTGDCPHGTQAACDEAMVFFAPHPVGTRLWVRETHYIEPGAQAAIAKGESLDEWVEYKADGDVSTAGEGGVRWRPSIHMPRWASRITLEVTGVKVERVQDITSSDAVAEGCDSVVWESSAWKNPIGVPPDGAGESVARSNFASLWQEINGMGSWAKNPWVWAYTFKVVEIKK